MTTRVPKSRAPSSTTFWRACWTPGRALVVEGRAEAVTNAIMQAQENDVVLLAGKGHEDYQIVGNRRLDYSDRVTAARLLGVVA